MMPQGKDRDRRRESDGANTQCTPPRALQSRPAMGDMGDRARRVSVQGHLGRPLAVALQRCGPGEFNNLHAPASPGSLPNTRISWAALIGARDETRLVVQRVATERQWVLEDYPDGTDPALLVSRSRKGLLLVSTSRAAHWSFRAFLGKVKRAAPGLAVVVLGPGADAEDIVGFLMAGANGYIVEAPPWEDLERAIVNAARGGGFLCKHAQGALVRHVQSEAGALLSMGLSPVERAIAPKLLQPLNEKQIADRLGGDVPHASQAAVPQDWRTQPRGGRADALPTSEPGPKP